jgi:hypothetical protein
VAGLDHIGVTVADFDLCPVLVADPQRPGYDRAYMVHLAAVSAHERLNRVRKFA